MTRSTRLSIVWAAPLALPLLIALAGCGDGGVRSGAPAPVPTALPNTSAAGPAVQPLPAGLPQLPPPAQVPPRCTSTLDHIVDGADCEPSPQQHVAPDASTATYLDFAPQWSAGQSTPGGLAYALYQFVPDLAHDVPVLHLAWASAPQQGDSAWVAVADFSANRWVWQAWQAGHDIPLDLGNTNVDNQGRVLAVVAVAGTHGPWRLGKLRIGANQPPTAQASVDHANQAPPYKAFVHADGSSDPDGVIVSYDYDLDGDGVADVTGVPDSTTSINVTTPGKFTGSVWVHDDDGAVSKSSFAWDTDYSVFWSAFPATQLAIFYALCPAPNNGYYAAGYSNTANNYTEHMVLVRFNADSTPVWARSLSSPHEDQALALAPAADGGAYIAGFLDMSNTGADLGIARYAPDGTLDWQKRWGGGKLGDVSAVAVDDTLGKVYITGSFDQDVTNTDAFLMQLNTDGSWGWTRVWGGTGTDVGRGVALTPDGNVAWGAANIEGGSYGGVLLKVSPAGNQLAKLRYVDANSTLVPRGLCVRGDGEIALFGYGQNGSGTGAPYCLVLDSTLALRGGVEFFNVSGKANDNFHHGQFAADGRLWLCGMLNEPGGRNNAALGWINDDASQYSLLTGGPAALDNDAEDLFLCADGGVLTAGYCWTPGTVGFQDAGLTPTPMSLTLSTPPENLYLDPTTPQDATDVSAPITGQPAQTSGALLYKSY